MHDYARMQAPVTPGSGLSGAGGAILVLLFFVPWFSACDLAVSGKVLAFGIDIGFGASTAGAYPWLALVPLAGLVSAGLAFFNLNQPLGVVRRRAILSIAAGGLALLLLAIVGIGFLSSLDDPGCALAKCGVEYGYIGSILMAGAVLAGGMLDWLGFHWGSAAGSPAVRMQAPTYQPPAHGPPLPAQQRVGITPGAWLQGQQGEYAGRQVRVQGDHWQIGRSVQCQLRLRDPHVSRVHALIRSGHGRYFLQDQGSQAGTQVNGRPVNATVLNDGDTIAIGEHTFLFRQHS